MAKHFPSLHTLLAFEATARHLNFTRAGAELNITQTAVSHRIKELERLLAVELFTRSQKGIALTREGRTYLRSIRPALAQIATATDGIACAKDSHLSIMCMIGFAINRLIPALPAFKAAHPDIDIRITPTMTVDSTLARDFDVAVWHGNSSDWDDLETIAVLAEEVFPVCAPDYLRKNPPLSCPEDLARHTVIRNVSPFLEDEWPSWLDHAQSPNVVFGNEFLCGGLFFTLGAIRSGLGVGIGRSSLVAPDLASGTLVELFDRRLPSTSCYHAVYRPEQRGQDKVVKFVAWLLETFRE